MNQFSIFWHRRDLRIKDNAGLYHALRSGLKVQPLFIFDTSILSRLSDTKDARVTFIHDQLVALKKAYQDLGSTLWVYYGKPLEIYKQLINQYNISAVFTNRDYEPYALQRDKEIFEFLKENEVAFKGYKDQVIFDKHEVLKDDGSPYTVFTPYMKKWKSKVNDFFLRSYPVENYYDQLRRSKEEKFLSLKDIGFERSMVSFPSAEPDLNMLKNYDKTRDIPSIYGTSRMSVHLRFGTVSIRELTRIAFSANEKYLNELIWREFYQMILYHFPYTVDKAFKPAYDNVEWRNDENDFQKWCEGRTGFPIVDAGMRELNATGYMHNRSRMITASFLTKHLLIDWRWGESYFASKLLDYDQASNVGGWQWAASSGCDAAPYFRVFNPDLQQQKFDPEFKYVKQWVPEWGTKDYPQPIVDHKVARERILKTYKFALES